MSPCVSVTNACSEGDAFAYHQTEASGFVRLNALRLKLRAAVRDRRSGWRLDENGSYQACRSESVGAAFSLVTVSRAGGFDEAGGFATQVVEGILDVFRIFRFHVVL